MALRRLSSTINKPFSNATSVYRTVLSLPLSLSLYIYFFLSFSVFVSISDTLCFVAVLFALRSRKGQISSRCKPIQILIVNFHSHLNEIFCSYLIEDFYESQWTKQLNDPLEAVDPEIADIIELEKARQWKVNPSFVLACFALD